MSKHPCLDQIWAILCSEYDLPKETPFPDLPHPAKEVEIAEYWALSLTVGNLSKWLEGKSFPCHATLHDIMNDLWQEVDNV